MEERFTIHQSDEITSLMEKFIPELRCNNHEDAKPCIAMTPCGIVIKPVWAAKVDGVGYGVFMPQHEKRYFFDTDLIYAECEEGDAFFYENVKCKVVKLNHMLALQFEIIN